MSRVLRRVGGAAAVTAILFAGGCTSEEEPSPAPEPPAAPEVPTAPESDVPAAGDEEAEAEAAEVPVILLDSEVMLPASIFPAGTYTFVVEQEGATPHVLSIEGPGVSESTAEIMPGGQPEQLTVTLEPGTYELWSSENGDRESGSETTIEVE